MAAQWPHKPPLPGSIPGAAFRFLVVVDVEKTLYCGGQPLPRAVAEEARDSQSRASSFFALSLLTLTLSHPPYTFQLVSRN